ncbi:MAG: DHH family phosphoesterase [Candidatus Cloacimonetes bacterium]|jgi:single-stranded-DNA-specific exonuclease|nr:DHH family phosphoesterase [Candidatus Cloacimonadota bacterium]MDD2506228.1 DHH family phosphoesterase [Candidatus Cloacimonadota bacterium]MDD4147130.1 DHH family phosphoesterase [Candidatus Cloacimonadota bacterium]MDD4559629.1 DHH family phosphoesterase [Candidatus Cloacimonadota bacterium]
MVADGNLSERILKARNLLPIDMESSIDDLPDEGLFANIDKVSERIREAIFQNEPMVIFGHDDPDGITSTYILYNYLNSCGYQRHSYYIPNRNLEPHGIQAGFIEHVKKNGYKLVITVDNGISAFKGVEKLNDIGCDVIITDHHLVQSDMLPNAYAVMNPQLPSCEYPFKALAGVGVVLMLIRYLAKVWEHPIDPASYFWTAVGSLADKVPMIGINRILVRHVLKHFEEVSDHTVQFLLRNYSRVDNPTDVNNFLIYTSRLIANGREEGGQHTALRFILQLSDAKARLFEGLEEQKNIWEAELNHVFSFLETLAENFVGNFFVYYDEEDAIPYSLLGTASTFIVNRLGIPTIMLKHHNGNTVCEGRCGEGFNMVDAFTHCKDHLIQFGGHAKAAGFSMNTDSYDGFLECFTDYLSANLISSNEVDEIHYDVECSLAEMNQEQWQKLEIMLPWGQKNPEPTLLIRGLKVSEMAGSWNLDCGGLHLMKDKEYDCLVLWRSANQLRILKILD